VPTAVHAEAALVEDPLTGRRSIFCGGLLVQAVPGSYESSMARPTPDVTSDVTATDATHAAADAAATGGVPADALRVVDGGAGLVAFVRTLADLNELPDMAASMARGGPLQYLADALGAPELALRPAALRKGAAGADGVTDAEAAEHIYKTPVDYFCRCSKTGFMRSLVGLSPEVVQEAFDAEGGELLLSCQFCNSQYPVTKADVDDMAAEAEAGGVAA
jgi:hypothetical protein